MLRDVKLWLRKILKVSKKRAQSTNKLMSQTQVQAHSQIRNKILDLILLWEKNKEVRGEEEALNRSLFTEDKGQEKRKVIIDLMVKIMEGEGITPIMIGETIMKFKKIGNTTKLIWKECTICIIAKWCNYTMGKMVCLYQNHQSFQCFNSKLKPSPQYLVSLNNFNLNISQQCLPCRQCLNHLNFLKDHLTRVQPILILSKNCHDNL